MLVCDHTALLAAGRVPYKTLGTGSGAMLIHGAGGCRFSPAIRDLARQVGICAPVLPGFDGSEQLPGIDTPGQLGMLLGELLDKTASGPGVVIGHSLGGHVACWLTVLRPELVGKLVLVCSAGFRKPGTRPTGDTAGLLYVRPEQIPPDYERARTVSAANQEMARHYRGAVDLDEALLAQLGTIRCPTLLLHGLEDRLLPIECSHLIKSKVPHAELVAVADAAHIVDIDQPQVFVDVVGRFIAGLTR